jgi:acyl dehydratase
MGNPKSARAEYRVQARNLSHASENKIHDDDVARRFGFQGGLVPGVEVYAYMSHLPVARWGVDWLERGTAECRFFKPVYDGNLAIASAEEEGGSLALAVDSEGERCATGAASLPEAAATVPAMPRPVLIPEQDARPEADEVTLAVGRHLSSHPLDLTRERHEQYLADIGETETLYAREQIAHPSWMLRLSNSALKDNVTLSAWIHTGSAVRHCAIARAGSTLAAHAVVTASYERKGHRFVDLDVAVVADAERVVAHVRHTAIYRLRPA